MAFKKILSIILAVVVGYFLIKFVFAALGVIMSIIGTLFFVALAGGVVYFLYRRFNHMLTSGKRLT